MRRLVSFLLVLSLSLFSFLSFPEVSNAGVSGDDASFNKQILSYVNNARAKAGLGSLSIDSKANAAAVNWSKRMAQGETDFILAHNPKGSGIIVDFGVKDWHMWGENVAKFTPGYSAQEVFQAYMDSPKHKANILNKDFTRLGLGTITTEDGKITFNTMEFIRLFSDPDPVSQSPAKNTDPAPSKSDKPTKTSSPKTTTPKAPVKIILGKEKLYYATTNANIRSGPGTKYNVVGSTKTNQEIRAKEYGDTGWVLLSNKTEKTFVSLSVLTTKKPVDETKEKATQTTKVDAPQTTTVSSPEITESDKIKSEQSASSDSTSEDGVDKEFEKTIEQFIKEINDYNNNNSIVSQYFTTVAFSFPFFNLEK